VIYLFNLFYSLFLQSCGRPLSAAPGASVWRRTSNHEHLDNKDPPRRSGYNPNYIPSKAKQEDFGSRRNACRTQGNASPEAKTRHSRKESAYSQAITKSIPIN